MRPALELRLAARVAPQKSTAPPFGRAVTPTLPRVSRAIPARSPCAVSYAYRILHTNLATCLVLVLGVVESACPVLSYVTANTTYEESYSPVSTPWFEFSQSVDS